MGLMEIKTEPIQGAQQRKQCTVLQDDVIVFSSLCSRLNNRKKYDTTAG